jgi:hypothetical protein
MSSALTTAYHESIIHIEFATGHRRQCRKHLVRAGRPARDNGTCEEVWREVGVWLAESEWRGGVLW